MGLDNCIYFYPLIQCSRCSQLLCFLIELLVSCLAVHCDSCFSLDDQMILPYPEPLIHFALVLGNRSGPSLRCYSPGNIDKELTDAARDFLRSGGLVLDLNGKVASVSKILNWYAGDFGKNEDEALKHASNYLEAEECQAFLELLADTQLKVVYQPYDWGLNY
ncbi:hypothetical protein LguiB_017581 [Lonicera macranthoides]